MDVLAANLSVGSKRNKNANYEEDTKLQEKETFSDNVTRM